METIWFGNYYDYRSAYFHDVMYSNQKPGREGALLFRHPLSSLQLALLYQRYKKFDERSYGLSNGTFFNVFSAEPLRLGRYQLPQCDTVILCATDPLTYSELKRYLNSFNVLKWFKAKFLQQKRKRQYILQVPRSQDSIGGREGLRSSGRYDESFFGQAVHALEYGRLIAELALKGAHLAAPNSLERGRCGAACDDHFACLQNCLTMMWRAMYWQCLCCWLTLSTSLRRSSRVFSTSCLVLCCSAGLRLLVGGDGRLLNDYSMEILLRVLAANALHLTGGELAVELLTVSSNALSSAAAHVFLVSDTESGQEGGQVMSVALLMTAGARPGGLRGHWGLQLLYTQDNQQPVYRLQKSAWDEVLESFTSRQTVRILPQRSAEHILSSLSLPASQQGRRDSSNSSGQHRSISDIVLRRVDVLTPYLAHLRSVVSFEAIGAFLRASGLLLAADCSHGLAAVQLI